MGNGWSGALIRIDLGDVHSRNCEALSDDGSIECCVLTLEARMDRLRIIFRLRRNIWGGLRTRLSASAFGPREPAVIFTEPDGKAIALVVPRPFPGLSTRGQAQAQRQDEQRGQNWGS